uniref:Neuroparsin n=1 Tax=Anopheles funestus TaxID=62324 RepID=A0A4Y0BIG5_ANOFN
MSSRNILLLSVLLMGYLYWSLAQPMTVYEMLCTLRQAVDNPNECKFGFFTNICQKLECWKGPGEECGDNMSAYIRYGQCASGLICCNGECKGCINGICNSEPCHPPHSYQLRSDPHMMERRMDPLYRIFDHYNNK